MFLELLKSGKITLKRGFAFKGKLPPGSEKDHICIILTKEAGENDLISYAYITSQENKAKKRMKYDPKALVTIYRSEYSEIRRTSFIQCGKFYVKKISFRELKQNFLNGNFDFNVSNLADDLIDRVLTAIKESRTFSTSEIKELLS